MTSETQPARRSSVPPPVEQFDLVVIGAGPSGGTAAAAAAAMGQSVAIVEMADAPGGSAVHTGRLPGETLRECALFLASHTSRDLEGVSVRFSKEATMEGLHRRTIAIAAAEAARIRGGLEKLGVRYIHGRARFDDTHTLRVERDGASIYVKGRYFLVSTGSGPLRPKIVPFDSPRVHDTDGIVRLAEVPGSLVILGAGIIGCEYASMFAAFGSKVTLVDTRTEIMPFLDRELVGRLLEAMARSGITVIRGMKWDAIHAFDDLVTVDLADGRTLDTDHLLYAAGRVGHSSNLGLERIGILPDGRGYIPVDDGYRTEVQHIFAAGDVIGPPGLASTSMEQGRAAIRALFEKKHEPLTALPFGVNTIPEVSGVGETEESAKKKNLDVVIGRADHGANARGLIIGDRDGLTKLVVDRTSRKLLGVHVAGDRATELVHIGQVAMAAGATVDVFAGMVWNYPTIAESYANAAHDAIAKL